VFTILEHEAMHQETLLYMWHRLPFAEARAGRVSRRASTARRRGASGSRSRRLRDARRRSARDSVRLGQRASGAERAGAGRSRSIATT
jgi:hypothetical protein